MDFRVVDGGVVAARREGDLVSRLAEQIGRRVLQRSGRQSEFEHFTILKEPWMTVVRESRAAAMRLLNVKLRSLSHRKRTRPRRIVAGEPAFRQSEPEQSVADRHPEVHALEPELVLLEQV